jgi:F-type H+-transporting ATPase subunit epsilon
MSENKTYFLEVVTPDKAVFSGNVTSLTAKAWEGYLGVMAGHAPMLCTLVPGALTIKQGEKHAVMACSGGFMEVGPKKVIILAEAAEDVANIDVERAKKAKERAEELLRKATSEADLKLAEAALSRAINRLLLSEQAKDL